MMVSHPLLRVGPRHRARPPCPPSLPDPPDRPARSCTNRRPIPRGFTLIELITVMFIGSLVLAWAVPSLDAFLQRRRMEGLSAQFFSDLQLLKTRAVATGESWRLSIPSSPLAGGYLIHDGAAGACTCSSAGQPQCNDGTRLLRGVCLGSDGSGLQLRANVASMLVDPRQATFSPTGSIDLVSPAGGTLRHVINIMGRLRLCSVRGRFAGVPAC